MRAEYRGHKVIDQGLKSKVVGWKLGHTASHRIVAARGIAVPIDELAVPERYVFETSEPRVAHRVLLGAVGTKYRRVR